MQYVILSRQTLAQLEKALTAQQQLTKDKESRITEVISNNDSLNACYHSLREEVQQLKAALKPYQTRAQTLSLKLSQIGSGLSMTKKENNALHAQV